VLAPLTSAAKLPVVCIKRDRESYATVRSFCPDLPGFFVGRFSSRRSGTFLRRGQMLENMFIGRPPGNYDRLLDFNGAVTGALFFAPSMNFLGES
jgi:porphyrinogen peroxidase